MHTINRFRRGTALGLLMAATFIAGCGGSSDDPSPNPSVSTNFGGLNTGLSEALGALGKAMGGSGSATSATVAIGGESTNGVPTEVSGNLSCDPSGTMDYAGTVTEETDGTGAFDLALQFKACEGLSGSLQIDGSIKGTETDHDVEVGFDGQLSGEGCVVTFAGFRIMETAKASLVTQTGNGAFSAVCGDDSFGCSFADTNLLDPEVVDAACNCSGAGCDAELSIELSTDDEEGSSTGVEEDAESE